jgi:hypothetical protein
MFPQLQFQHHERTLGLMDSAQQPQLPGRLLQVSDIKPDLQVGPGVTLRSVFVRLVAGVR